jgi:hypothetical protein
MANEIERISAEKLRELAERLEDCAKKLRGTAEEMLQLKIEQIPFDRFAALKPERLPAELGRIVKSAMDGLSEARWPTKKAEKPIKTKKAVKK